MEQIRDYQIIKTIAETRKSTVYRAKKNSSETTVIIKMINTQYASPSEIVRFRQEYDLIKSLDMDGIANVLDIVHQNNRFALILEDFDGISLKQYIAETKITIPDFLDIAIRLSETLGYIHKKNIIHKDIKPHNIIINPVKNIVKITDFGIANELSHKNEEVYQAEIIEGTLPYMSPEQTGRMNRTVDYRSDLYSLGITFYEILTGKLPFDSKEPMEIIYSHIARMPKTLVELDQNIPKIISDIVMKLMAKTAEERYQNSYGVMADLQECLKQFKQTGKIDVFPLGLNDISLRFNIPQLIIGREKEISQLMDAFERVSNGGIELMTVIGEPGIGKSAVINEIHKPIVGKRGYYISGKYGQFKKDVPYSAIIQAFQELIRQILAEREESVTLWKNNLLKALGTNGKLITDMIPDLKLIIGEQPDIPFSGPVESQNRFNHVFIKFISTFANANHPLVIFLDDLQWADSASLKLVKNIMTDEMIQFLFLIGSYRETEIDSSHILSQMIDTIKKEKVIIHNIKLMPLNIESINQLISNFLRSPPDKTLNLAVIIQKKTGGNPFFIIQFLKTLYDEKIFELDPQSGWYWDMEKVNALKITDNVVDLMADKIAKIDQKTQVLLKICACIGNRFELEILAAVMNNTLDEILLYLINASNEGFITKGINDFYQFHHDRIQEAAYSLLNEAEKSNLHYKIGHIILNNTKPESLENKIFYIVNQLNSGINLVTKEEEKIYLAELNLKAGKKAKASTAYKSAFTYFITGIQLLSKDCWEKQYDLAIALYSEGAECAYLSDKYDEMERLAAIGLKNAKSVVEKGKIYEMKIQSYAIQDKVKEAINFGVSALKSLGFKFPKKPNTFHVIMALLKAKIVLRGKNIEDLINLPEMKNPRILVMIRLLNCLVASSYQYNPIYMTLIGLKNISLNVKYGITPITASTFVVYGIVLCSIGKIDLGYRFGVLSLNLLDRLNIKESRPKAHYGMNSYIIHWKEHLREPLKTALNLYQIALEVGDIEFASYNLLTYFTNLFFAGKELSFIISEYNKYRSSLEKMNQNSPVYAIKFICQYILNIMGYSDNPCILNGTIFNEDKILPIFLSVNNHSIVFGIYYRKMILNYLFYNYDKAYEYAMESKKFIDGAMATYHLAIFVFYHSLVLIAIYPQCSPKIKKQLLKEIIKNQQKFYIWAQHAPMNNLNKYYLVEAELARILNKTQDAMRFYKKAIISANENEFINEEALAYELAAGFYKKMDINDVADTYFYNAYICYQQWGAGAKLNDLEKRYPDIITKSIPKNKIINDTITMSTSLDMLSDKLDLSTVIKSSQAISSEIDLGKLLNKIMLFLLENAGAQKGILILQNEKDGNLYIEADGEIDKEITVLQSIPIEKSDRLSLNIVNYVHKTQENVILNNAASDGAFIQDPYIIKNQTKSILCTPISHKGKISGILYMENKMAANAFTSERIELLIILSSQAAISIENALLLVHRENATRLQTEMKIAQDIQAALVPKKPVLDGYEITAYMKVASEVGGDYYDVFQNAGKNWIVIGDVSGHGVPAGLVMIMVQSCIHNTLNMNPNLPPSQLLTIINQTIFENMEKLGDYKYMTITVFASQKQGHFIFSGAHLDIMVYRAEKKQVELIATQGIWIGIMDNIGGIVKDDELTLNVGDIMLVYTDGIVEAVENKDKETFFGEERLKGILSELGDKSTDAIKEGILMALEDYQCRDDITLLILKRK